MRLTPDEMLTSDLLDLTGTRPDVIWLRGTDDSHTLPGWHLWGHPRDTYVRDLPMFATCYLYAVEEGTAASLVYVKDVPTVQAQLGELSDDSLISMLDEEVDVDILRAIAREFYLRMIIREGEAHGDYHHNSHYASSAS